MVTIRNIHNRGDISAKASVMTAKTGLSTDGAKTIFTSLSFGNSSSDQKKNPGEKAVRLGPVDLSLPRRLLQEEIHFDAYFITRSTAPDT